VAEKPAPPKREAVREVVPRPAEAVPAPPVSHEKIQKLAYEKWLAAGKPEGADVWFWLEAERELCRARCSS
jgi:hypothetical protein